MSELLIGCGNARSKSLYADDRKDWVALTTLDQSPSCKPDVVHDLNVLPLPFEADSFEEIHAYETLEHLGRQGDWRFFFDQWTDFHRIIKPGGLFFGSCPHYTSPWAWGDPSHTRIVGLEALLFLSQKAYAEGVGRSAMSDFREYYKVDWELVNQSVTENLIQMFVLRANK